MHRKLLVFWLLQLLIFPVIYSIANDTQARIANGYLASPDQFPWHAKLLITTDIGSVFSCGGAVLDPDWILTSARCVQRARNVIVSVGSVFYNGTDPNRVTRDGAAIKLYPRWRNASYHDDVALVRLRTRLNFNSHVRAIAIADRRPIIGRILQVSGFGSIHGSVNLQNNRLAYMTQRVIADYECDRFYNGNITGNGSIICGATYYYGQALCYGDDGAPLVDASVNPPVLIGLGVVGVGNIYCDIRYPSTFTNIFTYQNWIRSARSSSKSYSNFSTIVICAAFGLTQLLRTFSK